MQFIKTKKDRTVTVQRSTVLVGAILGYFIIKNVASSNYADGYGDALADAASLITRS